MLLHFNQRGNKPKVGAHARPVCKDMLVGLVQGPLEMGDQIGNRCSDRPRLAGLAVNVDGRVLGGSCVIERERVCVRLGQKNGAAR